MSLNWNFEKDFIGIAIASNNKPQFIYTGNMLMIFNVEFPDIENENNFCYGLCNFYADKEHLHNCIKDLL